MIMSGGDIKSHHQYSTSISDQDENPNSRIDALTTHQQQSKRNISKRANEGDDSFEHERRHRMVNDHNQYFNNSRSRQASHTTTSSSTTNVSTSTSRRPSFPPFRITFAANETPSELSIIKDINKNCHISLSYGRYSAAGGNKSFLLYANSSEQFDRLMDKNIWPTQICSLKFSIELPSKVPSSYSVVAIGVPAQWNVAEFESDIKKYYPTIIKAERLYIKGGIPISKVRIDFSSNVEVNKVIKSKRLLLDDEHTSFAIQPYSAPLRILRCYNCQQYNDHIAAYCPHKNNPVCFRCGQNHQYNPNCNNKICCANCHQDHLAGSPNCPIKIDARRKYQNSISSSINKTTKLQNASSSVWSTNEHQRIAPVLKSSSSDTVQASGNTSMVLDLSKKIDLLMIKIENLATEQAKLNYSTNNAIHLINECNKQINIIQEFVMNKFCPFVFEICEAFIGHNKKVKTNELKSSLPQLKKDWKIATKSIVSSSRSNVSLTNSSPNESISNDI